MSLIIPVLLYCILFSYCLDIIVSDKDLIISGATTIDQCGDLHLNVFWSSYLYQHIDFEWIYIFNNISNQAGTNREVFISNIELFNITNNINGDDIVNIMMRIESNSTEKQAPFKMITMDKGNMFPYIDIDGGNTHYVNIHTNNHDYYNIIPNIYYSQCFSNDNNKNMSLFYEWKQILSDEYDEIQIKHTNSKILQIPTNIIPQKQYLFQLTVSQNVYSSSQNVTVYTDYPQPIPLAQTIKSLNIRQLILTISIYDLFYFTQNMEYIMSIYTFKWLCYDKTNGKHCSDIIETPNEHEVIINTLMLSIDHYYIFELIITKHNESVSSQITYYIQKNSVVKMEVISVIPSTIKPLQTIKISICLDERLTHLEWSLTPNNYDYNTELLISNTTENDIRYYYNRFDYVHDVSFNEECPLQTNLYLKQEAICNLYEQDYDSVSVTFSAQNAFISTEINFAMRPFGGKCVVLNDIDSSSSPIALFIYKYKHLFHRIKVVCYDYIDIYQQHLYYNFMRKKDGIYLFDEWMMTTSYIELSVFIQTNYSVYGLIRNEFGYIASDLIEYTSSKSLDRSQFHVLTTDLIEMIDVDLAQSISIYDYKLSFIIISSFLDVFKYGIHEYDFVNEPETVGIIFDHLFMNLQVLRRSFLSSSSYLSLQMIHILHSLFTDDMVLVYIDANHIRNVLQLLDVIEDIECNTCCLFRVYDIISGLLSLKNDNTTELIINTTLYLSYLYLIDDISATTDTVHYKDDDRMSIELLTSYTNSNNDICRGIADITRIPTSYEYETVFCIKWIYDDIIITHLISSNPNTFELLWNDERLCTFMTTSIEHHNKTKYVYYIDENEVKYEYSMCLYWDFNHNEWIYNTSFCWVSHFNDLSTNCSCYSFTPILKLSQEIAVIPYSAMNISEHFVVTELNINNIFKLYPIPIYIISSLFLVMITFMALIPERSNTPLWLKKEVIKNETLIKDEMGAIYTIYKVYALHRCCNLYVLNLRNNWFLSEIFCRLYGTNVTSLERILLFYLYIITMIAVNTYFYSQHKYDHLDIVNISLYYPFILLSIAIIVPVIIFKYILKHIEPIDYTKINTPKLKQNDEMLNQIYSQIVTTSKCIDEEEEYSFNSDDTTKLKLNDLASSTLVFKLNTSFESVPDIVENKEDKRINRICIEEMILDPNYKWILDPNRALKSAPKSIVIKDFIPNEANEAKQHNFVWFTSICRNSIELAQKESEITRSTLDKILNVLPERYRDSIYCICNVDNEAFIVFEEYIEFIDAILLGTGQSMYSNLYDVEFDFRNMRHKFKEKVDIDSIFSDRKYKANILSKTSYGLSRDGALEIISKLRGINNKYCISDIAIPLLTGFTKGAMLHCLTYCSRIFWKILSDEWWDYDDNEKHFNDENILYHLTHTKFDDLFADDSSFDSSSESSLSNDTSTIPSIQSMNAPRPMNHLMIDERKEDGINDNNYYKRILLINKYYSFKYKWRKYVYFVIILCILYGSMITLIYGVHLDFKHYFENDDQMELICDGFKQNKIDFIRYNITQSVVITQNNNILNTEYNNLTSPWLYCLLIQLLMYIFIYQPIVCAISTAIQHQTYKYRFNTTDLMSFFID